MVNLIIATIIILSGLLIIRISYPRHTYKVIFATLLLASYFLSFDERVAVYSYLHHHGSDNKCIEKAPDNFVLSVDTPISLPNCSSGLSNKTYPIDILSYGVHFRIPRNYIDGILSDAQKNVIFNLLLRYPDFVGVTGKIDDTIKVTPNNAKWNWGISHDIIHGTAVGGELGKKSVSDYNSSILLAEANEPDQLAEYGLSKSTKTVMSISQDVYFKRPSKESVGFVAFCDRPQDVLHQCRSYIRVSDNLLIMYQYHRELLPHWQEMHQKITQLIQSFVVKEEK